MAKLTKVQEVREARQELLRRAYWHGAHGYSDAIADELERAALAYARAKGYRKGK